MTFEEIKKHAKPLVWEDDELVSEPCLPYLDGIRLPVFIYQAEDGEYHSNIVDQGYTTKEEAMQAVEDEPKQERS